MTRDLDSSFLLWDPYDTVPTTIVISLMLSCLVRYQSYLDTYFLSEVTFGCSSETFVEIVVDDRVHYMIATANDGEKEVNVRRHLKKFSFINILHTIRELGEMAFEQFLRQHHILPNALLYFHC